MPSIEELFVDLTNKMLTLANAIRNKTGKSEPLSIDEMATEQDAVFEAGKDAGTDAFWDAVQKGGNRTSYTTAFSHWGAEYIRPKYKVVATNVTDATQTFSNCEKLKKVESACFDLSQKPTGTNNNSGYYYTFYRCSALEEIEDIGLVPQYGYYTTFGNCPSLHTIAKIGADENTRFSTTFDYCHELQNLTIDGVIGQNGFNVRWSTKLTKASITSIINALSSTTSGLTVTISKTAKETAFTDAEWTALVATKPNWTISLA